MAFPSGVRLALEHVMTTVCCGCFDKSFDSDQHALIDSPTVPAYGATGSPLAKPAQPIWAPEQQYYPGYVCSDDSGWSLSSQETYSR